MLGHPLGTEGIEMGPIGIDQLAVQSRFATSVAAQERRRIEEVDIGMARGDFAQLPARPLLHAAVMLFGDEALGTRFGSPAERPLLAFGNEERAECFVTEEHYRSVQ